MISSYSEGMKQKIALISAFLHKPKLFILDEPLNALDPRSARIVKDFLHELKAPRSNYHNVDPCVRNSSSNVRPHSHNVPRQASGVRQHGRAEENGEACQAQA